MLLLVLLLLLLLLLLQHVHGGKSSSNDNNAKRKMKLASGAGCRAGRAWAHLALPTRTRCGEHGVHDVLAREISQHPLCR